LITENLSTLKIHKLTQKQYERELAAGRIDENALYLTPDEDGGDVTVGTIIASGNIYANNDKLVATREYVDSLIARIEALENIINALTNAEEVSF
jgi:hypothetical protein